MPIMATAPFRFPAAGFDELSQVGQRRRRRCCPGGGSFEHHPHQMLYSLLLLAGSYEGLFSKAAPIFKFKGGLGKKALSISCFPL